MKTNPPRRRSLAREVPHILLAARGEAARLGHPEVEVEHLLLGLLTTGGPAARALGTAGTGLEELRRAVVGLQQQDLDGFGLALAVPAPAGAGTAHEHLRQHVPVSGRASELLEEHGFSRTDDRSLLLALLQESARVRRLLLQAGVDPAALEHGVRDGLASPADAAHRDQQEGAGDVRAGRGDLLDDDATPLPPGSTRMQARHVQILPVPREEVWALVSSPQRQPEWDLACARVDVEADGTEQVVPTSTGTGPITQVVIRLVAGTEIAWAHHKSRTRHGVDTEGPTRTLHIRLEDHQQGCTLHLHKRWVVRGRIFRKLRGPQLERMIATQLRVTAMSIAQAATAHA